MSRRSDILNAITAMLTTGLRATFGPEAFCTRNLSFDPSQMAPEVKAHAVLWSTRRHLDERTGLLDQCDLHVMIVAKVSTVGADSQLVEDRLNDAEEVIDQLYGKQDIANLSVTVRPDSDDETAAGDLYGELTFPVIVRYPRNTGG